jgi:catechol 2,3-dioxygenase-like lactoylglutathione lyase family enzyme
MKLRTTDPFVPADEYGRSLNGLSLNLLVKAIEKSLAFQRDVLGATVVYSDPDFAVLRGYGGEWMLHADHTYENHPMKGLIANVDGRGAGVELRLHGCDPDQAEAAARRLGFHVLSPSADKPHGLREAHLVDPDGYVWVPDTHLKAAS